jgi:glycosyltransferase involved in cell wall biosynthesis
MLTNITIIIPIYNEEQNIVALLKSILLIYKRVNILVIDDFSDDKSVLSVKKIIKEL